MPRKGGNKGARKTGKSSKARNPLTARRPRQQQPQPDVQPSVEAPEPPQEPKEAPRAPQEPVAAPEAPRLVSG